MGITKLLASWSVRKIMTLFTVAYTVTLGASAFLANVRDDATIGTALWGALIVAAVTVAMMLFFSKLIVRYSYKHYENPTPKPRVTSHEQHLPEVS